MNFLNNIVLSLNDFLWSYVLIALLLVLGVYFTFKSNFVQFKYFKEMIRLLGASTTNKKEGQVSSFQAFCISTASRVGTGNIAGIAIAITLGGPGAVFWMWLVALIGSASSFVESTLAQIYKVKDGSGFRGGPAYYIEKGLNNKFMSIVFSILITVTFGFVFNSIQSNTVAQAFESAFGIDKAIMGIILAILTTAVIFGGVHRVAKISEVIVPIFAVAYILVSLFVILLNIQKLPEIFALIMENAFGLQAIAGGGLGATMLMGIKRGLFSNEAGMGSAPNAAATATTSHPVSQGLIQALGVFTDTLVICSCTAFIILTCGDYATSNLSGIQLTQYALSSQIGSIGYYFIAVCIFLFAFSSIVGNYYYGQSNIEFMTDSKALLTVYRLAVVGMVIFGSLTAVEIVWNLGDLFMALMAIINLFSIAKLSKFAFLALKDYTKQKKAGIKEPTFKSSSIDGLVGCECWQDDDNDIKIG
ncbi:alanine/glycine:cation symporter family protein [Paraclostridium ghonii]|uniref:AGCS family alanine or glycine:cation symporter n=1 Tax=Paraclostridium ghonii TaxID=29358 RepID=A0ABU0MYQ5_9FIRM|nr:alanine/glycine:cation symporter family protein [Paeniclostridium ghonii]MDQ0556052.1 AGCS family alanine or glycine:cation symporter [Paeniclostridium ghonii]